MLQKFDERNRDLIVNVGGRLSHRDEAGVSPFDSVVQGGDAVWEGLRLTNGRIFALEEHLARLRRSAHALGFASVPADEPIIAEIIRTLAANSMVTGVHIRLTLTRGVKVTSGMDPRLNVAGPTLIVLAEFKDPVYDQAGIRLITSSVRLISPVIDASVGTAVKPSACADLRSRARCSSSAKIRPLVSRRPSQTASPPCTTESNGDTPASSRCARRPPTLTIRSRLRASNCCSNEGLPVYRPTFGISILILFSLSRS